MDDWRRGETEIVGRPEDHIGGLRRSSRNAQAEKGICAASQRHTFAAGGRVYEAERREILVIVPDDAKLDLLKYVLCWAGDKGPVKSTAKEVFGLAEARVSGFQLAK